MTDAIAKLVDDMNETELRAALIKLGSTHHQEVVSAIVDVLDATRPAAPQPVVTNYDHSDCVAGQPCKAGEWVDTGNGPGYTRKHR